MNENENMTSLEEIIKLAAPQGNFIFEFRLTLVLMLGFQLEHCKLDVLSSFRCAAAWDHSSIHVLMESDGQQALFSYIVNWRWKASKTASL